VALATAEWACAVGVRGNMPEAVADAPLEGDEIEAESRLDDESEADNARQDADRVALVIEAGPGVQTVLGDTQEHVNLLTGRVLGHQ